MRIRVTTEFKDRHTNELHKAGTEMDVPVQRVNEILSVGNFIEIIEPTEQVQTETEETKTPTDENEGEKEDGEQIEPTKPEGEQSKVTGRRKKTK